jgi:hypothetical protein
MTAVARIRARKAGDVASARPASAGLRYATRLRNAQLDVISTLVGAAGALELRSDPPPADLRVAVGDLLARLPLPKKFLGPAADGVASVVEPIRGTVSTAGTAGHFRIIDAAGTCLIVGTVTEFDGGGGFELSVLNLEVDDPVRVDSFTIEAANA